MRPFLSVCLSLCVDVMCGCLSVVGFSGQVFPMLCLPSLTSPDIQHSTVQSFSDTQALIVESKNLHVRGVHLLRYHCILQVSSAHLPC